MNTRISAGPLADITLIGEQMRNAVTTSNEHDNVEGQLGANALTLTRDGTHWALTIVGGVAIQPHVADQVAHAVSVPRIDWWLTRQGCRWRCDWEEEAA